MTSTPETEDVVARVTRWIESEKASVAKRGLGHSLVAISMKVADIEALLAIAATPLERLREENARRYDALRNIAEGNLGDQPWQANYERIRDVARAALTPSTDDGL